MQTNPHLRSGICAAGLLIAGVLLSGPFGLIVVSRVQAQPTWQGAAALADNYHPIQTFPFFAGFMLVIGSGWLVATLYHLAEEKDKAVALLAVICTAAFTGLITFNYICQTTFIPGLLADYRPESNAVLTALSFSNGRSLCWAIEMWGYALLGFATWLLAPVFNRNRIEKTTAWLMVLNGVLSIAGGFISAVDLGWVMTTPGLINYVAWNVLMLLWGVFVILSLRSRMRCAQAGQASSRYKEGPQFSL